MRRCDKTPCPKLGSWCWLQHGQHQLRTSVICDNCTDTVTFWRQPSVESLFKNSRDMNKKGVWRSDSGHSLIYDTLYGTPVSSSVALLYVRNLYLISKFCHIPPAPVRRPRVGLSTIFIMVMVMRMLKFVSTYDAPYGKKVWPMHHLKCRKQHSNPLRICDPHDSHGFRPRSKFVCFCS